MQQTECGAPARLSASWQDLGPRTASQETDSFSASLWTRPPGPGGSPEAPRHSGSAPQRSQGTSLSPRGIASNLSSQPSGNRAPQLTLSAGTARTKTRSEANCSQWSFFTVPSGMAGDVPRPPSSARPSVASPRSATSSSAKRSSAADPQGTSAPAATGDAAEPQPPVVVAGAVGETPRLPVRPELLSPLVAESVSRFGSFKSRDASECPTEPQCNRQVSSDPQYFSYDSPPSSPSMDGPRGSARQPQPPPGKRGGPPPSRQRAVPEQPVISLYEQTPIHKQHSPTVSSACSQSLPSLRHEKPPKRAPSLPDATEVDCGPIPWYLICDTIPAHRGERNKLVVNKERLAAAVQAVLSGKELE
eukprot:TRINITY_DN3444_c0_g6_i1.p2 TRINITY_DN3444_c0_g6~~TRINITY_DN3444_c0_g6_i1.p2  ORF type:complete len:391 (+),score=59.62 TRINITY_DN3444_c0_g6_i1:93-1175(+)